MLNKHSTGVVLRNTRLMENIILVDGVYKMLIFVQKHEISTNFSYNFALSETRGGLETLKSMVINGRI